MKDMKEIYARWTNIEAGVSGSKAYNGVRIVKPDNGPGRPCIMIEKNSIEFLRELGFSWSKISTIFSVSRRALYSIRLQYGMVDHEVNFTNISDDELQAHVISIKNDMPELGSNMLRGVLRSQGIHNTCYTLTTMLV